jgi:uncharacterized repeat protein (TIGR03803 family)
VFLTCLFAATLGSTANAAKEKTLYTFSGGADGAYPAALALSNGRVFGVTNHGGTSDDGVIFEVTPHGAETALYSFAGGSDDASQPNFLLADSSGNFYGHSYGGGGSDLGTIFELSKDGSEKVLHAFSGSDGSRPTGLVRDESGVLYGTTAIGGDFDDGVLFELTAAGEETVLHSFGGTGDGAHPRGLTGDGRGNLYGTTSTGGKNDFGFVFKITKRGKEEILHSFSNKVDGINSYAALTLDDAGYLYGTTFEGGPGNCGTVFKLTPHGKETILHAFSCGSDGGGIQDTVVLDKSGNVYGAGTHGGKFGSGTFFKVAPDGTFTVLYNVTSQEGPPTGNIVSPADGKIFGTTLSGSTDQYGTIFEVKAK